MEEEVENWGPGRICIRASTDPSEPNIFIDDRKEAEKWEHLEELCLWIKLMVGLLSDIVNNGQRMSFFLPFEHHCRTDHLGRRGDI